MTSSVVLDELARGTSERVGLRLDLVSGLRMLPFEPELNEVLRTYLRHRLMPAKPPEDAMHLALASWHQCDFIVTWNCRHLANPNKAAHIRTINGRLGIGIPRLVTPADLLAEEKP